MEQIPVYVFTGFLDSGKTKFIQETLEDSRFNDGERTLKVATKFTTIAAQHYASRGRDIDIIKLNGSIELAPILGLSDVIVDIVETGTTLKENDLDVVETVVPISARLIVNKASFKFKTEEIENIVRSMKEQVESND